MDTLLSFVNSIELQLEVLTMTSDIEGLDWWLALTFVVKVKFDRKECLTLQLAVLNSYLGRSIVFAGGPWRYLRLIIIHSLLDGLDIHYDPSHFNFCVGAKEIYAQQLKQIYVLISQSSVIAICFYSYLIYTQLCFI